MAAPASMAKRQSFLELAPINIDLTAGTSIPPPQPTPPLTPSIPMSPLVRPPTAGGGPLSSHPTTPVDLPGAWISTPDLLSHERAPSTTPPSYFDPTPSASPIIPTTACMKQDTFRRPLSPASGNVQVPPPPPPPAQRRDSKGVRKLLSLSSLRNSFSSSRTSLLVSSSQPSERPSSRSTDSSQQGVKRSFSPAAASTSSPTDERQPTQPPLRKRKSQGWFRRKSSLFLFADDDSTMLDSVTESQQSNNVDNPGRASEPTPIFRTPRSTPRSVSNPIYRPASQYTFEPAPHEKLADRPESQYTYQSSRMLSPPPMLPEIETLKGGRFDGGALHADELFAGIGR
ncbi:hypothetical protein MBLNU459_g2074t1 [Dothideomycetes sp. NU459]